MKSVRRWLRLALLDGLRGRRSAQILLLFLLLRLSLVGIALAAPEGGVLIDSTGYLALRNRLVGTGQYANLQGSAQDLNWPPGYPTFLALIQLALGSGLWAVTLVQLAISAGLCLAVLRLGHRTAGPGAGLIGAWILALSPNLAVWSLTVMSEVLFAALLVLASLALMGWSEGSLTSRAAASGLLLGVAAYVRPIALLLLPAWVVCLAVLGWRSNVRRRALTGALALPLAVAVLTAPWFLRNRAVHGELAFSTVGAKTLVNFNLAEVLADAEGISRNEAAARMGEGRSPFTIAFGLLRDYPANFVKTQVFGVVRTAMGTDIGAWGNVLGWDDWTGFGLLSTLFGQETLSAGGRETSAWETVLRYGLLLTSLFHAVIFLGLAAVGVLWWPSQRARLVYWLPLVTVVLLILVPGASGQSRFRVPSEPFLAMFAGAGGVRVLQALRPGIAKFAVGTENTAQARPS